MESKDEQILEELHPALFGYTNYILWGIVLSVLVIGIFILVYVYFDQKTRKFTITSKRVIIEYGIFAKNRDEVDIAHIRSLNISQSLMQRLFKCGDIFICTSGTAGVEILLNFVPNPRQVADRINHLKEQI